MRIFRTFCLITGLVSGLAACVGDETLAAYGGNRLWQLRDLDNRPYSARATVRFAENGRVTGQAACNRFFATQTAPYPWITLGPIGATRMACPDLAEETRFLGALSEMTLAEVSGDVLILSNDADRRMVFKAVPDGG